MDYSDNEELLFPLPELNSSNSYCHCGTVLVEQTEQPGRWVCKTCSGMEISASVLSQFFV
jgi:hypothetical protein